MGGGQSHDITTSVEEEASVLVTYACKYLGDAPIGGPKGDDLAPASLKELQKRNLPPQKVKVTIAVTGISVYNMDTNAKIRESPLGQVTSCCIVGKKSDTVAYIEVDLATRKFNAIFILMTKINASGFVAMLGQAFEKQVKTRNQRGNAWGSGAPPPQSPQNGDPSTRPRSQTAPTTSASSNPAGDATRPSRTLSTVSMDAPPATVVVEHFKAKYLGHTTVTQPSGQETVTEAVRFIKKTSSVKKVFVYVSAEKLQIVDRRSSQILQSSPMSEVSFCMSGSKKDIKLFSFITCDPRGVMFCHSLQLKSKGRVDALATSVGAAFVTASNAEKRGETQLSTKQAADFARHISTNAVPEKLLDPSAPIGLFEAQFLGTIPTEGRAQPDCEIAAIQLFQGKKNEGIPVAIMVNGEGIKTIETLTGEEVQSTIIKNIVFTSIITDPKILKRDKAKNAKDGRLFVYINQDPTLNRTTCEIYRSHKRPEEICKAINQAFQVAVEVRKKRKGNPFAPLSDKRERIDGPLYKRQIHRSDLNPMRVIGMGQFGEVYLAEQAVKGGEGENGGGTVLRAVKLLRNSANAKDRTEFLHESETMLNFDHPNLVNLIGVAVQQRPWLCVLEYMSFGDLRDVMKVAGEKGLKLTFIEQLKFVVQIATGMDYLASLRFIHMDLAARNCLLGHQNLVKIADFGLTRRLDEGRDYYRLQTTLKLPIKWMAPESMDEKIFSEKSDVWSFGVTCWEIFSYGQTPYGDIKNIDVQPLVREGLRLERTEHCPQEFYDLLQKSWNASWRKRPSFADLRKMVLVIAGKVKDSCPPMRDVGKVLQLWVKRKAEESSKAASMKAADAIQTSDDKDFSESGPSAKPEPGIPEPDYDRTPTFIKVQAANTIQEEEEGDGEVEKLGKSSKEDEPVDTRKILLLAPPEEESEETSDDVPSAPAAVPRGDSGSPKVLTKIPPPPASPPKDEEVEADEQADAASGEQTEPGTFRFVSGVTPAGATESDDTAEPSSLAPPAAEEVETHETEAGEEEDEGLSTPVLLRGANYNRRASSATKIVPPSAGSW